MTQAADGDSVVVPLNRKNLSTDADKNQSNKHFVDVDAKGVRFQGFDFSFSIFDRVYFRNATFENCKFIGCRFKDCNFKQATFLSTDLRYTDFTKCLIDVREIAAGLPRDPNLRAEILQNLRANAASTGDQRSISFLVLEEIKASKEHHYNALIGADDYYRKKYSGIVEKTRSTLALFYYWANGLVWGYGEKPLSMLISLIVFLLLLSFINFWAVLQHVSWYETSFGSRILAYTFENFLNIKPDFRFQGFRCVDYTIGFLRYIYAGLFVTSLVRSISHR